MTTLQFVDTHNLVAFFAKPAKSEGFEQIVNFLNIHTIKYALTVNPTIYTSCIEQFWATINGEVQLQALVDGKKIIVTKASIRSDLPTPLEKLNSTSTSERVEHEITLMVRAAEILRLQDSLSSWKGECGGRCLKPKGKD
ncbi:hypothetical protein Tco_1126897 [Tanacetum coccineum]